AGRKHGAIGYLVTDWGDGGHPQPLAVSYFPLLAGAALSWCANTFDERQIVNVLSRDVFYDPSRRLAAAARALGLAHRPFRYREPNSTPFGIVIAAPPQEWRESFCRGGLECYARIAGRNLQAAEEEVARQRAIIRKSRARNRSSGILALELDLAARM